MLHLSRHPDVAWPPVFGGAYAGAQPLMTGLEGTLLRVERVPTVGPAPLQIRLVALYEGHEFSGILECPKPVLLAELQTRLSERIGRPLRELGDIELPVNPFWNVTIEGAPSGKWPGADATFRLRTENRIYVERQGGNTGYVRATAHIDGQSATDATRWVYWKLRETGAISQTSSGLFSASATDDQGRPADVVMEAVVRKNEAR